MPSSSDQISSAPQQLWWLFSQSPLLVGPPTEGAMIPKSPITFHVMTPISYPMKKGDNVINMHSYLEEDIGNNVITNKVNPQEAWLPITESRSGNAFYAAFHTLCSGIGFQALMLPLAFSSLGERLGKLLSLFPIMYLSGGTCVGLIMFGSGAMKIFYEIVCGPTCKEVNPLTILEWYMVFTCCAVILAQLPNLNSIALVSLIGSVTAVGYCTLIWVVSVSKDRPTNVSYEPSDVGSHAARVCRALNAVGMIVLAFRGHNLVLEIQGTMPTSSKQPSRIPMWRGVKFAYVIVGMCLFPLAIGGHWAYGNLIIPTNNGLLKVLYKYHGHDTSKFLLCFTSLLVVIHSLSSFQIYAMPVFDNLESRYTSSKQKPCPRWLRSGFRAFFGCLTVFIAFALPFLPSLAGLLGGIALPLTLAYPCFMWIQIKKPRGLSFMWYLNWGLGCLGILLSILLVTGAIWSIVIIGIPVHFFKP